MFEAKIILDSVSSCDVRLISMQCTYPRFIHSEMLTHRMFSRNSASSRAIPWSAYDSYGGLKPKCMKYMILNNPVIPLYFGSKQAGMQSGANLSEDALETATQIWLEARDSAVYRAEQLNEAGVHKSLINRLTEPWMWITVLISATEWTNFFKLRCHRDAEKHMQKIAYMMKDAYDSSVPVKRSLHMPYVRYLGACSPDDSIEWDGNLASLDTMKRVSSARCARLSYLTHDDRRDMSADVALFDKLIGHSDGVDHMSPLESVAESMGDTNMYGNFRGWRQFRKDFVGESGVEFDLRKVKPFIV